MMNTKKAPLGATDETRPALKMIEGGIWNDAQRKGTDCPEWQALLAREVTFFTGKHGKLTNWNVQSATWWQWIEGGAAGGFSIHRTSKKKSIFGRGHGVFHRHRP
jgi:hypothetical protein